MSTRRPLPATHRPKHVFLGMVQEAGGPTWQSVELGLHEKPPGWVCENRPYQQGMQL
jgi:hypothetical protein